MKITTKKGNRGSRMHLLMLFNKIVTKKNKIQKIKKLKNPQLC